MSFIRYPEAELWSAELCYYWLCELDYYWIVICSKSLRCATLHQVRHGKGSKGLVNKMAFYPSRCLTLKEIHCNTQGVRQLWLLVVSMYCPCNGYWLKGFSFEGETCLFFENETTSVFTKLNTSTSQAVKLCYDIFRDFQRCQSQIIVFISTFKLKININKNLLVNFTI